MTRIKKRFSIVRDSVFDFSKGMLCFIMVLSHVLDLFGFGVLDGENCILRQWIVIVNMPGFFIISGYFFKNTLDRHEMRSIISGKVKSILWPWLVWDVCIKMTEYLLGNAGSFPEWIFVDQVWFLSTLFRITIVCCILYACFEDNKICAVVFVVYLIIARDTSIFVWGFLTGLLCNSFWGHKLAKYREKSSEGVFLIVGVGAFIVHLLLCYVYLNMAISADFAQWVKLIAAVLFLIFLLCLACIIEKTWLFRVFASLGTETLGMYVVHIVICYQFGFRIYHKLCMMLFDGRNIFAVSPVIFEFGTSILWTILWTVLTYYVVKFMKRTKLRIMLEL